MTDVAAALHLLVVDDDQQMLDLMKLSLNLQGFLVSTALSGAEALQLARDQVFDAVVMDVLMSPLDGFETVRRMRDVLQEALPPIVYLSGLNREADMPRFEGHPSAFLLKPFRPSQLVSVIGEICTA